MITAAMPEVIVNTPHPIEPLLGVEKAAEILGQSHWTLRHYIREGRIRSVRIGRRLMVESCELRRFIDESRIEHCSR